MSKLGKIFIIPSLLALIGPLPYEICHASSDNNTGGISVELAGICDKDSSQGANDHSNPAGTAGNYIILAKALILDTSTLDSEGPLELLMTDNQNRLLRLIYPEN